MGGQPRTPHIQALNTVGPLAFRYTTRNASTRTLARRPGPYANGQTPAPPKGECESSSVIHLADTARAAQAL